MESYLDVEHYLNIYKLRLRMAEDGTTNPSDEIKELMRTIVDKLSKLPLDEKITLDDHKMKDVRGNVIVEFPK
jgi:hypothetical protein